MLYFLGNCQMDFLSRAVADLGLDSDHRVLASPLTYTSSPGKVPRELSRLFAETPLDDYTHGRSLDNQFRLITREDAPPSLIVLNLFHELTPLLIRNKDGAVFYLAPQAWAGNPELEALIRRECRFIQPNPGTYLKRYSEFLTQVRKDFPDVPMAVVTRLSHYPAFGPQPYSYLKDWDQLHREGPAHFRAWGRALDGVHIVDMDRVFAGIWTESGTPIETHCPFLKITLTETDGAITGVSASRDVEHIGPMWSRLAQRIAALAETGEVSYADGETVPKEWHRPWRPNPMDEDTMLRKLASGSNYACAEAVGAFYLDLSTDYSELLARTGHLIPVCHNTLHMIKNYNRLFRNPVMALWADAHEKTARQFTANGPLYRADYLRRIADIRALALS